MTEAINYKDVMDLGFKRKELHDPLFFNQYGFEWFIVQLKLNDTLTLSWDCNSRVVILRRMKKSDIKNILEIKDLKTLQGVVKFFTENNTSEPSVLEINEQKII